MFKKTIISEFFTTVSFSQMMQSLYLMTFGAYKLRYGKEKELFEKELLEKIKGGTQGITPTVLSCRGESCVHPKIISFYNGRSAIYHCLKIIGVDREDEVIVNGYNCVSVSNAVIQTGAKIVYSDIESETLSFDFEVLKKNITEKTKVIILQHTFGKFPRDYKKIIDYAGKNNILVIEDLAHFIPHPNPPLTGEGTIKGDFAIFSTGRDKVISSVTGGFLLINNKNYLNSPLLTREGQGEDLKMPSIKLIYQNLNYNIFGYLAYKTYDFLKLGRIIIFLSRKLKLITEILSVSEKSCNFNKFNLDFPNALAYLARKELEQLDKYTEIRLENSKYYNENISNNKIGYPQGVSLQENYNGFRFPILLESEEQKLKLIKFGRENNIIFGNQWSGQNIIPIGTVLDKIKYKLGTCPIAEDISKRILTLPNHNFITKKDLSRVVEVLNKF